MSFKIGFIKEQTSKLQITDIHSGTRRFLSAVFSIGH